LQLKLLDDLLHTRGIVQKLLANFRIATGAQAVIWHVAFWQERSPKEYKGACAAYEGADRPMIDMVFKALLEHKSPD
jgi:hypothetical protein